MVLLAVLLALPLAGLALLLGYPDLDAQWDHQPSHFWLVLTVAVVSVGLGLATGDIPAVKTRTSSLEAG